MLLKSKKQLIEELYEASTLYSGTGSNAFSPSAKYLFKIGRLRHQIKDYDSELGRIKQHKERQKDVT